MLSPFLPLDKQFDGGLGAMAWAFHHAAKELKSTSATTGGFQRLMPVCYLYRHSLELFLKSLSVIVWRKYSGSEEPVPRVNLPNGKSKPLDREHGLVAIFDCLQVLSKQFAPQLSTVNPKITQWPAGFRDQLVAIDGVDRASDYFRYPTSRSEGGDVEKSSMKPESVDSLMRRSGTTPAKVFAAVVVDDNYQPTAVFSLQEEEMIGVLTKLADAAELLSGMQSWYDAQVVQGL